MYIRATGNRRGAVLVVTLLVLALITVMGIYSATKAGMEQKIAGNAKWKTVAFFAAEGALNHAKELLTQEFADANTVTGASTWARWDFYLGAATHYHCQDCDAGAATLLSGPWLANPVTVLSNSVQSGSVTFDYVVYVWDNYELTYNDIAGGDLTDVFFCSIDGTNTYVIPTTGNVDPPTVNVDPTTDCDSTVIIRAIASAVGSGGEILATSVQELSVSATTSGEAILPGLGQEFEGSGDVDLAGADTGAGTSTIAY